MKTFLSDHHVPQIEWKGMTGKKQISYFYKIIGKTSFYFQSFQNRGVFFVTLFDSRDKDMLIWLHFQQTSFLLKVNNDGSYIVVFTFMVGRPAGRERGAEENKIFKNVIHETFEIMFEKFMWIWDMYTWRRRTASLRYLMSYDCAHCGQAPCTWQILGLNQCFFLFKSMCFL